ncbi:unnamed protein product [Clavelina lepadiformis]|uniref:Uncharacterized protein n=1 Tax=Clavelina lepadiformis TaxID=159417 RepID=A0ABP0G000_CLALP
MWRPLPKSREECSGKNGAFDAGRVQRAWTSPTLVALSTEIHQLSHDLPNFPRNSLAPGSRVGRGPPSQTTISVVVDLQRPCSTWRK